MKSMNFLDLETIVVHTRIASSEGGGQRRKSEDHSSKVTMTSLLSSPVLCSSQHLSYGQADGSLNTEGEDCGGLV